MQRCRKYCIRLSYLTYILKTAYTCLALRTYMRTPIYIGAEARADNCVFQTTSANSSRCSST